MQPARAKSPQQVRAIFAAAKAAGIDFGDKELRGDIVESVTHRTRHLSEVTYAEAERVIQKIKGEEFVPRRTLQHRRQKAGIQQLVQQPQLQLIADLAAQRNWTAQSIADFCQRMIKRERPATTAQANIIIEALKDMNRRENLWAA